MVDFYAFCAQLLVYAPIPITSFILIKYTYYILA